VKHVLIGRDDGAPRIPSRFLVFFPQARPVIVNIYPHCRVFKHFQLSCQQVRSNDIRDKTIGDTDTVTPVGSELSFLASPRLSDDAPKANPCDLGSTTENPKRRLGFYESAQPFSSVLKVQSTHEAVTRSVARPFNPGCNDDPTGSDTVQKTIRSQKEIRDIQSV